jgi:23S rRNA (adenine2503-C2)-methyltransferase
MPILFKDLTAEQLHARLADLGVSGRLARRLQAAVMRQGQLPAALPEVSPKLLDAIRRETTIPQLTRLQKVISPQDGFAKYLFTGDGPEPFEAVRIPLLHRPGDAKYVVCVSSQVGCAMGCAFCATGRMGFRRDLAAWEIVDQVIHIQADSPHPVRGVVFMGMGEPLLNYDRVMQAADVLRQSCGMAIAGKAISISTVGIVPAIRRFTREGRPYRLVVSLTTADAALRRRLMPVEKAYPSNELIDALREYHAATGQRVMLAWTMISGVNTSPRDAQLLAELVRGLPIKLDLIDVNDPTGQYRPPDDQERNRFRDALTAELGVPVDRRYSGGQDIHAACGMLAGRA